MSKKLYRSEDDRIIAGICGGLAEYFDIDASIVRLIFILIVLYGGSGILVYIILWIVLPVKSSVDLPSEKVISENTKEIEKKIKKGAKSITTKVKSDTKEK
jgi:phage shock protein C